MNKYKVRVGEDKRLVPFDSFSGIFDWVRDTFGSETVVFSVLTYEHGDLESMDRWWYNGDRFVQENILS